MERGSRFSEGVGVERRKLKMGSSLGVRLAQSEEGEGWDCWAHGLLEGVQATERCEGI